jgi:hypothetical protein
LRSTRVLPQRLAMFGPEIQQMARRAKWRLGGRLGKAGVQFFSALTAAPTTPTYRYSRRDRRIALPPTAVVTSNV